MRNIKAVIIIISVAVLIVAVAAGVRYCKSRFYVPDKNGMVFSLSDTVSSCRYESGGGKNGELTEAEIYVNDNGEVWLSYHYRYPVGTDTNDINFEAQLDSNAIENIREICRRYGVLGWGKLKRSDILVLDGATDTVALKYADKEYYSFNSGLQLPDGGEEIFDEISEIINKYVKMTGGNTDGII